MTSLFRYRELIRNLVLKDLKLKYRDSVLGFVWSLANPLLLILVYGFVFSHILRVDVPNFSYFLLIGILPWNFFSQAVLMSTGAVLDNGALIRKVAIPAEVFPIATVLFSLVQYFLALFVFMPMILFFFGIALGWLALAFFPVLIFQLAFTLGLSFVVSTATVFYRDVRHFAEIFLTLLFWLTPIIYDVAAVPQSLRTAIFLNPLSYFILSYQDILYRQTMPGLERWAVLSALSVASLALGYLVQYNHKARFAEEV